MTGLDVERLVFIDETWTATNFTRLRGRAPRNERLIDKVPHGHWKTTTFVAALRCDRLTAPIRLRGKTTSRSPSSHYLIGTKIGTFGATR